MNVLAITNLFPNSMQPNRGLFNKQQFMQLLNFCHVTVVSPIPWFPKFIKNNARSIYGQIKEECQIGGIKGYYPKYKILPKIGRSLYGRLMYWGIKSKVFQLEQENKFDVILATWAYPDAYAAMLLAKKMNKPLVIKVHGSDVNVFEHQKARRKAMKKAFRASYMVIAVSQALKDKIVAMGIDEQKVVVLTNAVNKSIFKPLDKNDCRDKLELPKDRKQVLSIGNLVDIKGTRYLVEALKGVDKDTDLNIVGDGELKESLEKLAKDSKNEKRIRFIGRIDHSDIPVWMNAADVFCLPSLNEGCPNVLLEAICCGTPVVASNVGGIPELARDRKSIKLSEPQNSSDIAQKLKETMEENASDIVKEAEEILDWHENAKKLFLILDEAYASRIKR